MKKYQVILVLVGVMNIVTMILPINDLGFTIGILTNLFPMTIMTFSFVRVRRLFLKYQEDKYQDIKTALWLYYVFDMFVYAIQILFSIFVIIGENSPYLDYINNAL